MPPKRAQASTLARGLGRQPDPRTHVLVGMKHHHLLPLFCALSLSTSLHAQTPLRMGYGGSTSAFNITECDNGDLVLSSGSNTMQRIHADGTLVWAKSLATPYTVVGVSETLSGDLLVALNANNPDLGHAMPALVRLAADGSFIQGSYLNFPVSDVRAHRFMRTTIGRHILLVRNTTIGQDLNTLVCFNDAGAVLWAISPDGTSTVRMNDMAPNVGGGVLVFDAEDYSGVVMAISVVGTYQWGKYYGLGAFYGGVIYGAAPLPNNQIAFVGRAASFLDSWGNFLVMSTDQFGTPLSITGYDPGGQAAQYGNYISSNFAGDLVLGITYGSSDEMLMHLDPQGAIAWAKRNGNDVPQFGGDVRFLSTGGFTHLVQVNEYPGLRYFKSDLGMNVEGCYENLEVAVLNPPTVASDDLNYPLLQSSCTFTDYTVVVSDNAVEEVFPCISTALNAVAEKTGPRLSPVPATDRLRVEDLTTGSRLIVRNIAGQALFSTTATGPSEVIDVLALSPGAYLLDVWTPQGRTTLRFIK